MKRTLVLGIGNRLMMDDGVGVAVVEALAKRAPAGDHVLYAVGETDVGYCLDLAEETDQLILVDAVAAGARPGTVRLFPLREFSASGQGLSVHQLHLVDLLLQQDPQTSALLVGIEPYRVAFHWGLSAELAERFEEIVADVKALLQRLTEGP